ncbi:unnamed protein product, partial [marine sediment metagenome]
MRLKWIPLEMREDRGVIELAGTEVDMIGVK